MVFWTYFPSTSVLTCNTGLLAFQRQLFLEYGGGPEKDQNVCVFGGVLCSLSVDLSGQLDVLWHYGYSPGVGCPGITPPDVHSPCMRLTCSSQSTESQATPFPSQASFYADPP